MLALRVPGGAAHPIHEEQTAVGMQTAGWKVLVNRFPCIFNGCIGTRDVLTRDWGESTTGTGFDNWVQDRMLAKNTCGMFGRWPLRPMGKSPAGV